MPVIVRRWTARATIEGADRYQKHFIAVVVPKLARLDGFRGALVLREATHENRVILTDLTFWESLNSIDAFSGTDISRAIVDDTAQSLLLDYDKTTTHSTVVVDARAK